MENVERWEDDGSTNMLCFAYTFHNYTKDSHITLWLSSPAAQWLFEVEAIRAVQEYVKDLRST